MRIYVDANILVSMFTDDASSERAEELLSDPDLTLVVTDFALAEYASSIARRFRMQELSRGGAAAAFAAIDAWSFEHTKVTPADIAQATAWIRRLDLNLRAPDAIHLATAGRLALPVATFDLGMARAAEALGLPLAPV